MTGKILKERYEIREKIGEGGMSTIYLAFDSRLKRNVAIKVLRRDLAENEEILSRFIREAQSAARLIHPNIINVYDIEEDQGVHYMVMEYMEARNLKKIIEEQGAFSFDRVYMVFKQIAQAVKYAHDNGIIHRDLKPQNVLINEEGTLKVTDFGIARAITASSLTQTGTMMGSVQYFSPEQAQGKAVDRTADIYSMGIMLFECLTGSLPFDGDNPIAVALKQVQEDPPGPSSINRELTKEIDGMVAKCLSKSPRDRFQDVDEFIFALGEALYSEEPSIPGRNTEKKKRKTLEPTLVMKAGPLSSRHDAKEVEEKEITLGEREETSRAGGMSAYVIILIIFLTLITWMFVKRGLLNPIINKDIVPDLEGYTLQKAREVADDRGWQIRIEEERYDGGIPVGVIIFQKPKKGEKLERGGSIEVVISKGKPVVEVPDLTGLDYDRAREELTRLGLNGVVGKKVYSDRVDKDRIISHEPSAQEMVAPGQKIVLVVSNGREKTEVPDLTGLTEAEAQKIAVETGLKISVSDRKTSDKYLEGSVISQQPAKGKKVDRGTVISVVLSKGQESINAPNLVGKTVGEARDFLDPMGIRLVLSEENVQNEQIISRQDPPAGSSLGSEKSINIHVEAIVKYVTVPNLLGRTLEDAQNVIDKSRLSMGKIDYSNKPGNVANAVLDQNPRVGSQVEAGTKIDLTVSSREPDTEPTAEPSPAEPVEPPVATF